MKVTMSFTLFAGDNLLYAMKYLYYNMINKLCDI